MADHSVKHLYWPENGSNLECKTEYATRDSAGNVIKDTYVKKGPLTIDYSQSNDYALTLHDTDTNNLAEIDFDASSGSQEFTFPNKSGTLAVTNDIPTESTVSGWGFTKNTGTITGVQLNGSSIASSGVANVQALPNFSLNISHQTAGNPRQVKFLTINYNTAATYFKMSATSCHDNGTSYQFLEDIIIGCTTSGTVVCNIYKYCQQSCTLDSVTRYYGDVFYVIDTTNKIIDFYILCGQYASSQFTPATKIGNTTIAYITQYTGTAAYYSSGTKVWGEGCGTTYARKDDVPTISASASEVSGATEAKSLNINGTDWNLPSGGGGGSGITEISTQYVRIWGLAAGVYKLTYNGTKYLYYSGSSGTSTHTVEGSSGAVILTISDYSTTYKHWWYINGETGYASIYHGYTSSSSGRIGYSKVINSLVTAAGANLYLHVISGFQNSAIQENPTTLYVINARSGAYKSSSFKTTNPFTTIIPSQSFLSVKASLAGSSTVTILDGYVSSSNMAIKYFKQNTSTTIYSETYSYSNITDSVTAL